MTKSLKYIAALLIGIIAIGVLSFSASATSGIGFTVTPIIPDNQRKDETAFFDIMVTPGTVQTLQVLASNYSEKEIVIEVKAKSASTSSSGSIDYTSSNVTDESLKYPFSEMIIIKEKVVKIPPGETKLVEAEVKLPEKAFDGIILGSISLTDITYRKEQTISENDSLSIMIQNEYEYVIAVVLRENEAIVEPSFELGEVYSVTEQGRHIIVTEIRNTQPVLVKGLKYSGYITSVDSQEKFFEVIDTEVSFAPNSTMSYKFRESLKGNIPSGEYAFIGSINDDGKTWDFSKTFVVKEVEQNVVESTNPAQTQNEVENNELLLIIAIGLAFAILALIIILTLIIKRIKQNK